MTKEFEVIKIDEELSVVLEKPLHPEARPPFIINHQGMLSYDIQPPGRDYKKIIATIGRRIEGIPLIEIKNDYTEALAAAKAEGIDYTNYHFYFKGYKAAQKTYSEVNQDLYIKIVQHFNGYTNDNISIEESANDFLQSLQKKKVIKSVVLEGTQFVEEINLITEERKNCNLFEIKITNRETNSISPIKINYE